MASQNWGASSNAARRLLFCQKMGGNCPPPPSLMPLTCPPTPRFSDLPTSLQRPFAPLRSRTPSADIDYSTAAAAVSRGISWLKMQTQLQPSTTYSISSWIIFWGHQDRIRSFCHTMAAFLGLWLLVIQWALLTPDLLSAFPVSPERYVVESLMMSSSDSFTNLETTNLWIFSWNWVCLLILMYVLWIKSAVKWM